MAKKVSVLFVTYIAYIVYMLIKAILPNSFKTIRSRSKDSTVLRQRKTGPLYSEHGVKLLRGLFDILVKRAEGQPKQRGCLKRRNGESTGKCSAVLKESIDHQQGGFKYILCSQESQ